MKLQRSYAVTMLPLVSEAAAMHTALMLFAFRKAPTADHLGMLIWWAALFVCHGVLSAFLRKPRELRSVVLVCALLLCVQLGVTVWLNPVYPSFTWWFAAVCMWAAGYYHCAMSHLEGVKPEALMVNFETTALTLFVAVAISGSEAMDGGVVLHLLVGLLCVLSALMALRTLHTRVDTEARPMAGLLMPLILLGTGGCAVLFCLLIGGYAHGLLTAFTAWLGRVLKAGAQAVGSFIYWLFSLLPKAEGNVDGEGFESVTLPSGSVEGVPEQSGALLYVLVGAVLLALLVLVVKVWRNVRTQGRGRARPVVRAVTVRRLSPWDGLRRFFRAVQRRLRFELHYLGNRNTAAGLLVWLERRMAAKGMKRGRGETPKSFLERVAVRYPACGSGAVCLAEQLDRYYFGDGGDLTADQARSLRKAIKQGMKEQ